MVKKVEDVYLIDASIYIFKYYFSLPDNWWSREDFPTAAVYGYAHWLFRFLKNTKAKKVAACFDESLQSCFRNKLYADYKSSRALPDDALAFQLAACKQITGLLGIPCYASKEYEADDLLGTLAMRCRSQSLRINLLTRDKDLAQLLLNAKECIWDYPDGPRRYPADVQDKFGVAPTMLADLLAIVGDPGDDIPGVPGVGVKTAAKILQTLGPWQKIRKDVGKIAILPIRGAAGIAQKLLIYKQQIDLSLKLATIASSAPLGRRFSVNRLAMKKNELIDFGLSLGFGSRFAASVNKLQNELIEFKK